MAAWVGMVVAGSHPVEEVSSWVVAVWVHPLELLGCHWENLVVVVRAAVLPAMAEEESFAEAVEYPPVEEVEVDWPALAVAVAAESKGTQMTVVVVPEEVVASCHPAPEVGAAQSLVEASSVRA